MEINQDFHRGYSNICPLHLSPISCAKHEIKSETNNMLDLSDNFIYHSCGLNIKQEEKDFGESTNYSWHSDWDNFLL